MTIITIEAIERALNDLLSGNVTIREERHPNLGNGGGVTITHLEVGNFSMGFAPADMLRLKELYGDDWAKGYLTAWIKDAYRKVAA